MVIEKLNKLFGGEQIVAGLTMAELTMIIIHIAVLIALVIILLSFDKD